MPETAFLHIQADGDPTARVVELTVGPIRIGRGAHCEVRLSEPSVAEVQCLLKRRGTSWQLQPVGPPGPVWVEGRPLDRQRILEPGVPVRVGDHWLTLHATPSDGSWGSYDMPIPVETPGASVHRIDPTLSTFDAESITGRSPRSPEPPPRAGHGSDPDALAAEAERLKAWQQRLEQRERWLHDRREERKWEARLKATGEQLRARSSGNRPRPEPPAATASAPPRPGFGGQAVAPGRPTTTARPASRPASNRPVAGTPPPTTPAPIPDFSAVLSLLKTIPLDLPPPVETPLLTPNAAPPNRKAEADERYEASDAPLISATFDEVEALCAEAAKATFLDPAPAPAAEPEPLREGVTSEPEMRTAELEVEVPFEDATEPEAVAEVDLASEVQVEPAQALETVTPFSRQIEPDHVFEIEPEEDEPAIVAEVSPPVSGPFPAAPAEPAVARPEEDEPAVEVAPRPRRPEPASEPSARSMFDTGTFTTSSHHVYAEPPLPPVVPAVGPGVADPSLIEEPEQGWPSARTIFESQGARESRVVRRGRVVERGPQPSAGIGPDAWVIPFWVGLPLASLAAVGLIVFGLGLSALWVQDDLRVKLAERTASTGLPLPGETDVLVPGDSQRTWLRTTAANLGVWARAVSRSDPSDERDAEVRRLLDSARSIAPLDAPTRFAQSQLTNESGDGKSPERPTPGQSRDPLLLAWSASRLRASGKVEPGLTLFRRTLEILVESPIREAEATEKIFDEDVQVQRYLLPRESAIRSVLLELTGGGEAPLAEWEKALPSSAVTALAAARLLREKGRAEADRLLIRAVETESPAGDDRSCLAEHHAAQAEARAIQSNWVEAEESYRLAIEAMPDLTSRRRFQYNLARLLERQGKDNERKALLELIRVREPGDELTRRIEAGNAIVSPIVRRPRQ